MSHRFWNFFTFLGVIVILTLTDLAAGIYYHEVQHFRSLDALDAGIKASAVKNPELSHHQAVIAHGKAAGGSHRSQKHDETT